MRFPAPVLALVLTICAACASEAPVTAPEPPAASDGELTLARGQVVDLPLSGPAGEPFLYADGERLVVSWIEKVDEVPIVRTSSFDGSSWDQVRTVTSSPELFVNWADFPSVVPLGGERLLAHWLHKSGPQSYAYDVRLALSEDRGASWRELGSPHATEQNSEYGFVSIEPDQEGGAWISWLDGRDLEGDHGHDGGAMQIRAAHLRSDGSLEGEQVIDDRTCECCQSGMAMVDRKPLVVWRDRSPEEIRDIAYARLEAAEWSNPSTLHADGWKIPGCPVNGPQIAAEGSHVAVAWFTAANDRPAVKVALSADGGRTFSEPLLVSDVKPLGRVDVVMSGREAIVTWLEEGPGGTASLRMVPVSGQRLGSPVEITTISGSRASGFPRAAILGRTVWVGWTIPGAGAEPSLVRMASVRIMENE